MKHFAHDHLRACSQQPTKYLIIVRNISHSLPGAQQNCILALCHKYEPQTAWCTAKQYSHPALRRY
jgi:hypothetical protein